MKPPRFEYCRPETLDEALELLTEFGSEASVLSGGQSLGAMLNMRLVRPAALIDINHVDELAETVTSDDSIQTGALMRQAAAARCSEVRLAVPLLAQAMPFVGHYQTRSRGTLGGSVAHADPSAEIPLCLSTLGGSVILRSRAGTREMPAQEFFLGVLTTARRSDELVSGLNWPRHREGIVYAFEEIAQRHGDFAIVAVAVAARVGADGLIRELALGLGGAEDRPVVFDTKDFLGEAATDEVAEAVAHQAASVLEPMRDLQASADYRCQLVRVLAVQALSRAFREARRSGRQG